MARVSRPTGILYVLCDLLQLVLNTLQHLMRLAVPPKKQTLREGAAAKVREILDVGFSRTNRKQQLCFTRRYAMNSECLIFSLDI